MGLYTPQKISSAGRPELLPDEIELAYASPVQIETNCSSFGAFNGGTFTITTHRVLYQYTAAGKTVCIGCPMQMITDYKKKGNILRGKLVVYGGTEFVSVECPKKSQRDALLEAIQRSLTTKEWERAVQQKKQMEVKQQQINTFANTKTGVGGLLERERQKEQMTKETLGEAFTDLDSLMKTARELVGIAEKFKAANERTTGAGKSSTEKQQDSEFADMMANLGIASPVTKEASGGKANVYHEQLARQLYDFLQKPLETFGGLMTMIDVYCIYNRARSSTELVAPDDILAACKLFQKLNLSLNLTSLDNGKFLAVEAPYFRGEENAKRLRDIAEKKGSITTNDLVSVSNIPLSMAMRQLEDAEKMGYLCRDQNESTGLQFFPNMFGQFVKNLQGKQAV